MAISKLTAVSPAESASSKTGPTSSFRRLEQALHTGNVREAKLAFDVAVQGLPTGASRGKELTSAVTALNEALKSGDVGKASDALASVKQHSERAVSDAQKVTVANSTNGTTSTGQASTASEPRKAGILDVKA